MENNASKHIKIKEGEEGIEFYCWYYVRQDSDNLDANPPITNFRVSEGTVAILKSQGIETLFPIQSQAFDFVYDGLDIIGAILPPSISQHHTLGHRRLWWYLIWESLRPYREG